MPKDQPITRFAGKYRFLSNFFDHPIFAEFKPGRKIMVATLEHAFQAAKAVNEEEFLKICYAKSPGEAKRFGKTIKLRAGWDGMRDKVMKDLLKKKFSDNVLAAELKATGDADLIEGNTWGDKYWGVCDGEGQNKLGKLLMEVRAEL